jgi:hypothetical protein
MQQLKHCSAVLYLQYRQKISKRYFHPVIQYCYSPSAVLISETLYTGTAFRSSPLFSSSSLLGLCSMRQIEETSQRRIEYAASPPDHVMMHACMQMQRVHHYMVLQACRHRPNRSQVTSRLVTHWHCSSYHFCAFITLY